MVRWMVGVVRARVMALHRDERGAIAVLVLLLLWVLIAVIGLVWNNAEETYRRARMQTAADAATHAASTWMSRTVNSIAAQNMVISQDASEETIWRAVPPTDVVLMTRMIRELDRLEQMRNQQNIQARIRQLVTRLANIAAERQLTMDALGNLQAGIGANYADANEAARYANIYRQSVSAREWVWNTYVYGNQPPTGAQGAPPRPFINPGPGPGPNGEGLSQLLQDIVNNPPNEAAIIDYIENFIYSTELPMVHGFERQAAVAAAPPMITSITQISRVVNNRAVIYNQVSSQTLTGLSYVALVDPDPASPTRTRVYLNDAPASAAQITTGQWVYAYPAGGNQVAREIRVYSAPTNGQQIDLLVAAHEAQVYADEVAVVDNMPLTIEQERAALADYYKTDITLATLKRTPGEIGPALVSAPIKHAADVMPVTGYSDSIRAAYPAEAAAANLPLTFDIDPMNVHVNQARIWHPNVPMDVPAALRAQYPALPATYTLNAGFPDGWGHIWVMPLEHYTHLRVNGDLRKLQEAYLQPLDQARTVTLRQVIRQMLGKADVVIKGLPNQIPDDQPEPIIPPLRAGDPIPPPRFDAINVLPRITAPANATAAFRAQVALYNQHGGAYTGAVRGLASAIQNFISEFELFITPFAVEAWQTNVNRACVAVLEALGQKKQFMVLSTYGLRPIPDWAQSGMFDSAAATIEDQLVLVNLPGLANAIRGDLQTQDPNGVGSGILDQQYRNAVTAAAYAGPAAALADQLVRPMAHVVALRIAAEWVNRPWPYEITPPSVPVPPYRGVGPDDRKREFTVIGAARQTDATAPGLLLARYFGSDTNKLVAYGQGETFNWMEFNTDYGGSERHDEVVSIPEVTYRNGNFSIYHDFVGSPRGWRVDSLGGWNWRTRLSLSDALYDAVQVNDELRTFLQDAGVNNPSRGALDEINLH